MPQIFQYYKDKLFTNIVFFDFVDQVIVCGGIISEKTCVCRFTKERCCMFVHTYPRVLADLQIRIIKKIQVENKEIAEVKKISENSRKFILDSCDIN